jgi:O-6-methylguanine DNA methyltransferase
VILLASALQSSNVFPFLYGRFRVSELVWPFNKYYELRKPEIFNSSGYRFFYCRIYNLCNCCRNPKNYGSNAKNTIKDSDVYELLLEIPAGKVSTYRDLAKALGKPLASMVIGRILGRNPNPIKVPRHRIVMSDGTVGGYS